MCRSVEKISVSVSAAFYARRQLRPPTLALLLSPATSIRLVDTMSAALREKQE
jgi:hypothetical protein